jgi:hypothetical protein
MPFMAFPMSNKLKINSNHVHYDRQKGINPLKEFLVYIISPGMNAWAIIKII